MKKKKLVIIDGNSLLYRAFFALPMTLSTSTGVITNAVYGFMSMIIKLLELERPFAIAVAWDKGKPKRLEQYDLYKAHRKPTAHELIGQFPVARELLAALRIPSFESEGHEADDILATMAKQAEKTDFDVTIVTGDRDMFQLISPGVKIMTTRRGITDIVVYDKDRLHERYGIPPERVVDMLSLKGDPSDNIPGVPGIGEKTALALVQKWGSLENIFKHIDEVTPNRAKEALKNHPEEAKLSKRLAILDRQIELEVDYQKLKWDGPDFDSARQIFEALEFRTLFERLQNVLKSGTIEKQKIEVKYEETDIDWLSLKVTGGPYSVELSLEHEVVAVSDSGNTYVSNLKKDDLIAVENLMNTVPVKIFPDIKKFSRSTGTPVSDIKGEKFDLALAAYIIDPSLGDYSLEALSSKYLDAGLPDIDEVGIKAYIAARARTSFELYKYLAKNLKENKLEGLYQEIELPLVEVISDMELRGVKINVGYLSKLSKQFEERLNTLTSRIYEQAGGEFNINSTQQLSEVLYDKLGLKPIKKTKKGLSTSASTLLALKEQHPIIGLILEYRELAKLKGTYVDTLPKLIDPETKKIHTTLHQTVTATGRLSSSDPNLQNIPIRTEIGRAIRKAFIPSLKDGRFLVSDYNQIELRILAYLSGDEILISAFESGEDIHTRTASEVFGIPLKDVDSSLRRKAKAVNFGIVYGIGSRGLAEQLGVLPEEAKEYIELYFKKYKKVKEYIDRSISSAYVNGYTSTIFNRRRYLPELKSSNYRIRSFGERLAVNTPIQGSAADIIKIAMINIHRDIHKKFRYAELLMQVHDELVFEFTGNEKDFSVFVKEYMENAYEMTPALKVNISAGPNWQNLTSVN